VAPASPSVSPSAAAPAAVLAVTAPLLAVAFPSSAVPASRGQAGPDQEEPERAPEPERALATSSAAAFPELVLVAVAFLASVAGRVEPERVEPAAVPAEASSPVPAAPVAAFLEDSLEPVPALVVPVRVVPELARALVAFRE
jgi:hypothetical protein